jgi:oligoendopeptidase F
MERAWQGRYGDTLSQTDPMFWASKLHFSLSSAQFYNFPYAFGYLFSLGVVATREKQVCCSIIAYSVDTYSGAVHASTCYVCYAMSQLPCTA